MMSSKTENIEYQLRRIAGIIGLIQAVTWMVLSLIAIAFFLNGINNLTVNSYMDQIGALIYIIFIDGHSFSGHILSRPVFFGFMLAHLVLNIVWFVTSIRSRNFLRFDLARRLKFWAEATAVVSALDFITVILLGVDYHNCLTSEPSSYELEQSCANGVLPVLVIAARGFVLWIINVIFAQLFYKMARRLMVQQMNVPQQMTVQQQQAPQGYPAVPNTPDWNNFAGSPYPQGNPAGPTSSNWNNGAGSPYPQGNPAGPTSSNWNNPVGSPYPQYQQQMSYSTN